MVDEIREKPILQNIMVANSRSSNGSHPLLKALALLVLSIGLAVSIIGGYFFYSSKQISDSITALPESGVIGSPEIARNWIEVLQSNQAQPTSPLNILLLGSDTREGQGGGFGSAQVYTGARSDTALLIHLNTKRTHAVVMSIPRDLLVSIPSCAQNDGSMSAATYARFNSAFDVGGPPCTVATVKALTGLEINHLMIVDFNGFQDVVDALGGLEVCLTQPVSDEKAKVSLPAGRQRLNGKDALGLARARYTLADGSDLARIVRQQAILRAAVRQVKDSGVIRDPARLKETLLAAASSISTDPQLASFEGLASLALQVRDLPLKNVEFITFPWVYTGDGETVSIDQTKAAPLMEALASSALPLSAPKKEGGSNQGGPSSGSGVSRGCEDPVL